MTVSLAAAKKISQDAAMGAVLSELDDIFAIKEEQRMSLKAFHQLTCQSPEVGSGRVAGNHVSRQSDTDEFCFINYMRFHSRASDMV